MEMASHIFKLAAGIGLFLFAMYLLEESLKNLSGRNFKLFLQRVTRNRVGAAAGGAIVTAVLQSSSMVSLMVLAFVGAGVFTMENALAIILGANLGTTLDSWVVATLGFNMEIEWLAYPAICVGGALMITLGSRKTIKYVSYFLFGFGLLFIALSYMKSAMESQVKAFDFAPYAEMSLAVFLLIGFVLTLIVQSSSVTMALTLSALNAGAIGFAPAAAMVLGSEVGTNVKILLSGIGGNATKKRVALGNFLFNVVSMIVAFILIRPILSLITDGFGITNPLIGLVTFSTFVNLSGVAIFLPFLKYYTRFLERFFKKSDGSAAAFIGQADVSEPQTAMDLFRKETRYFLHNAMLFNCLQLDLKTDFLESGSEFHAIHREKKFISKDQPAKYDYMKLLQGELQAFYLKLRAKIEGDKMSTELNQLIAAVRSAMYAVKCVKDIGTNIQNLHGSSKEIKFDFFVHNQQEIEELYRRLLEELLHPNPTTFADLQQIYAEIDHNYVSALNQFYQDAPAANLDSDDITTIISFNRELFTANKALLMAVKDMVLDEQEAAQFNDVPVYRT